MGDDIWYGDIYAGAWHFTLNDTLFQKAMLCTLYMDAVDDLKYLLASQKWGESKLISSINEIIEARLVTKRTETDPGENVMDQNIGYMIWSFIRTDPEFDINEIQLYAVGEDYTPLSYAATYGHFKCVMWLVNVPGIDLHTAKDLLEEGCQACEKRGNFEIMNTLLDAGLDINAKDHKGWTLLHYRVLGMQKWKDDEPGDQPYLSTVRYLLSVDDIDVNVQNDDGDTPLMLAVKYNKGEAAKMLLEAKADLDIQNNSGQTWKSIPIHKEYASEYDIFSTRQLLKRFLEVGSWNFYQGWTTTISAVYASPSHTSEPILWLAEDVMLDLLDHKKDGEGNLYIKTPGGWVHVEGDLASPPWNKR